MSFLIDTDVLVDNQRGAAYAAAWLAEHAADRLAVSVISVAELYIGAYRQVDPTTHLQHIRATLSMLRIIDLTDVIVSRYAREYTALQRRGEPLSDFDLLIGATALEAQLTVVTRNVRHFSRISGLTVLDPTARS